MTESEGSMVGRGRKGWTEKGRCMYSRDGMDIDGQMRKKRRDCGREGVRDNEGGPLWSGRD